MLIELGKVIPPEPEVLRVRIEAILSVAPAPRTIPPAAPEAVAVNDVALTGAPRLMPPDPAAERLAVPLTVMLPLALEVIPF